MVEFAIVASLFLMLTLGLIDLGRGVWIYNTLAHVARDGARYAIVHGSRSNNPATPETITDIVKDRSTLQNVVVTPSWDPDNNQGSAVQVTAQYDFQPLLPALLGIDHIPLSATARMVISY